MPFYFFAWTDELIEYLAEHDVSQDEFEQVVCDPIREECSRSTGRPIAFGFTSNGKYLACVFERFEDDTVIPVTAYEPGAE